MTGRIIKGVGGQYTVLAADGGVQICSAKGVFRHKGLTPFVGDFVTVEDGVISAILDRQSCLQRPPIANIDQAVFVVSACSPAPNPLVLDRLIAIAECKGIEPILVFTKCDLASPEPLATVYKNAGFPVVCCDLAAGKTVDGAPVAEAMLPLLQGRLTVLSGNSGVGKSTLLSHLFPEREFETGEISEKLGRGRHTTRHTELFPVEGGGFVADTPGFSSWDAEAGELITKDALARGFREFADYIPDCRFTGCSHTVEKGCAVRAAVKAGEIAKTRHQDYCELYNEVKNIQEWQLKERKNVIR